MAGRFASQLILYTAVSLSLAAPAFIGAQTADRPGAVHGVVFDSLITSRLLEGAEVWIESTNRMAKSDAAGNFVLSDVPPGRYLLTLYHPILDSAGLSLPPVMVDVISDNTTDVALATPSPAQAHHLLCPQDPLHRVGAILAVVRSASDGQALGSVMISAHWTTYDIAESSVRTTPRSMEARSDPSGHVLLCGLPTDVALVVRGRAEGGSVAMMVLDMAGRAFARADLHLGVSTATGMVRGIVRNRNGSLIPGASVLAVGTDATVIADAFGRFSLTGVTAGSGIVEARAVGYIPGHTQTLVRPDSVQEVDIILGDSVTMLDPVTVVGEYTPYLQRIGFIKRRETSQGHFLDTADVQRSGAVRFEDIFRMVPGARIRPNGTGYLVELQRDPSNSNSCPPAYFVDGVYYPQPPLQTPSIPIVPTEILAVEVYSNLSSAPVQYQRREGVCGVILVWTKRGVPKHRASH
ncbi:MAG: hypothetical protein DMD62_12945 [Gemmatimonadetes bacterium]|nr:MAG: hypothetical protein DMD62_12945 [Gemmatimonadota bacterium]